MRFRLRLAVAGAVLVVCLGAWFVHVHFSVLARAANELACPEIDVRVRGARRLAHEHDARSTAMLAGALSDPAARVRRAAGRSLYRLAAFESAPDLLRVVRAEPDPLTRYELMVYWADLSRPGGRQELDRWRRSDDPWDRLAWGKACLLRGNIEGAPTLFQIAADEQDGVRAAAGRVLREICLPMGEMIGSPVSLSGRVRDPIRPGELVRLEQWWRQEVSPQVLAAAVRWQQDPPDELRRVGKLVRAQERIATLLGLATSDRPR